MSTNSSPVSIRESPAEGQSVEHDGTVYTTIREGGAFILVPPNARTSQDPKGTNTDHKGSEEVQSVFYNPIQQFNRDLSVLAIKAFGDDVVARRLRKRDQKRAKKDKKRPASTSGDAEPKKRKGNDGEAVVSKDDASMLPSGSKEVSKKVGDDVEGPSTSEPTTTTHDKMEVDEAAAPAAKSANGVPTTVEDSPPIKFRILDALSATGLRALRYATEIPFATSVVSNDMSEAAVASIALNVKHNKLESKIKPSTGNAIGHMYQAAYATTSSKANNSEAWAEGKYDVVDLDPYGTAVPFLDAAIQSLNDGGLLCVTCTDAGVFASCGYVEKTYSLYGGLPVKGAHSHEAGLRLILNAVATAAGKYGIAIEPLLSLSIDYYARVFVRVRKSPADVKFLAGKTMLVHSCDSGCGAWQTQYLARHTAQNGRTNFKHTAGQSSGEKNCPHCGFKTHVAGPMWGGPIHNPFFIQRILDALPDLDKTVYQTTQRIEGMLTSALDELDVLPAPTPAEDGSTDAPLIPTTPHHIVDTHPFFFIPSNLSKILHCRAPSEAAVKGALRKAGFVATRSHCKPGTIKTQASWGMIWEIFREWVRQEAPIREGAVGEKMAGYKILQQMRKGDDVDGPVAQAAESEPIPQTTATAVIEGETSTPSNPAPPAVAVSTATKTTNSRTTRRPSITPEDPKKYKIVFDEALGKDPLKRKLTRYQSNPRENWGPMSRAKITTSKDH
ncbi:hypothetical protein AAFC00_001448 [Neodothiora populina]|uniref:tRNA (guanine(26)-N(2))-dimethyltransferase n=1 Tax=Neodothiora populina TaxID=2781224 RepID=A0ABR3PQ04_9PEZI